MSDESPPNPKSGSRKDEPSLAGARPVRIESAGDKGEIPIEVEEAGSAPIPVARARIAAKPVLQLTEDHCPKCGDAMEAGAVVCVKCGYDLKANVVREAEVGVEEAAEAKGTADFVKEGRGSGKFWAGVGAAVTVAALFVAGVNAPGSGAGIVIASVLLALYNIAVHTGTGIAAVAVAARLNEERFTRVDVVAGRMFFAVAMVYALINMSIPGVPAIVGKTALFLAAAGVYWGMVFLLFRRDRMGTTLIALAHFVLWVLVQVGMMLSVWLNGALVVGKVGG